MVITIVRGDVFDEGTFRLKAFIAYATFKEIGVVRDSVINCNRWIVSSAGLSSAWILFRSSDVLLQPHLFATALATAHAVIESFLIANPVIS